MCAWRPCCHIAATSRRELGQWLCVPPFRVVCPCQVSCSGLVRKESAVGKPRSEGRINRQKMASLPLFRCRPSPEGDWATEGELTHWPPRCARTDWLASFGRRRGSDYESLYV